MEHFMMGINKRPRLSGKYKWKFLPLWGEQATAAEINFRYPDEYDIPEELLHRTQVSTLELTQFKADTTRDSKRVIQWRSF